MKVIKIVQDSDGKVGFVVSESEKYEMEEHLDLLAEFVAQQARELHESRKALEILGARVDEIEKKLSRD